MSNAINIEIPYPPSGNHMWKHARGKHYLTDEAKAYYQRVAYLILITNGKAGLTEPVQVTCWLYPPDKRKRDLENAWKVISDALTKAGVWEDDSLVRRLIIQWCDPEKGGRVVVNISQYTAPYTTFVADCV